MTTKKKKSPSPTTVGSTTLGPLESEISAKATVEKEPPKADSVRFHVRRLDGGIIQINSPLLYNKWAPIRSVIDQLPSLHRKNVQRFFEGHDYYTLEELIRQYWGTVSPEDWAKAMATAAIHQMGQPKEGEYVAAMPLTESYLAAGDYLYRLTPVALTGTTKGLNAVKRRAIEKAKEAADKVKSDAEESAKKIINVANATANSVVINANKKLVEAETKLKEIGQIPPAWIQTQTRPIIWDGATRAWRIVMTCVMVIKTFTFKVSAGVGETKIRTWKARTGQPPVMFQYSAALGASFAITGMKTIFPANFNHPHITTAKSCMQPADSPRALLSIYDLAQLDGAVNRTLNSIDMNSMLSYPNTWPEEMWRFVPEDLAKILRKENWHTVLENLTQNGDAKPVPAGAICCPQGHFNAADNPIDTNSIPIQWSQHLSEAERKKTPAKEYFCSICSEYFKPIIAALSTEPTEAPMIERVSTTDDRRATWSA